MLRRAEKKVVDGPVQVKARKNSLDRARLGLVVPKRVPQKHTTGTKLNESFESNFAYHNRQLPSVDIVVQVFGHIAKQQLAQALQRQFDKLSGLSDSGPNN